MKKLIAALLAMALVTGCSTTTEDNGSTIASDLSTDGLQGELVMMTNTSGGLFDAVSAIVDEFELQNPGVTIEFNSLGKDYESLMKAKMAANDLPDVFATHGWSVNRYKEYLRPLNDQSWYGNLVDEIIPSITDKDGSVYTLPLNIDKAGIVYNYAILEEIKMSVPSTWDEFLICCEAAKVAGYTPVYLAGKDPSKLAGIINTIAPTFLVTNETNNHAAELKDGSFDWTNFEPVFTFLGELRDSEYLNVDYLTADAMTIKQKLANNEVLFAIENNATMADAYALNSEATLNMMTVPTLVATDAPLLFGGEREAYGVWKDSENEEVALALLDFMAQDDNIAKVSKASGMPVSTKTAPSDLGIVEESFEKYASARVFPKFDREYMPNGMWSTMKTVGAAFISGSVDEVQASEMMRDDYLRFRKQAQ